MKPVIGLVGRPNVGKSTFFNRLTSSRDALVADYPGVTRDRQYGACRYKTRSFLAVDTGGLGETDHDSHAVAELVAEQSMLAAEEAMALIWIVDGRTGLTPIDETLAETFRKLDKPIFLAVNKIEGQEPELAVSDFYNLGIEHIHPISARRGDGVEQLLDKVIALIPDETDTEKKPAGEGITVSVLGKPNVGKSTLINRMIGEERVLTFDHPGTTRDSIRIPFQKDGRHYTLIDTAGIRRKSKVQGVIEKFSVIKSLDAIDSATIVMLVIDAGEGVTEQDSTLLGMIEDSGKSVIIAINKWDAIQPSDKDQVKSQLSRKFAFIDYARYHYLSALHGTGVGHLFESINKINASLQLDVSTSDMTEILKHAVKQHPPRLVRGHRIKLRYAHIGGHDPIRVIIHGNQTEHVSNDYKRYLAGFFRQRLNLVGTTVLIKFKHGDNPYKDKPKT